eukprot:6181623-Pleurochrysis_carterae.AAC.4
MARQRKVLRLHIEGAPCLLACSASHAAERRESAASRRVISSVSIEGEARRCAARKQTRRGTLRRRSGANCAQPPQAGAVYACQLCSLPAVMTLHSLASCPPQRSVACAFLCLLSFDGSR